MEITYKDEIVKLYDRTNQWCWNNIWDTDLGKIKVAIDKVLTEKYKGMEAYSFYNSVGDKWFFDHIIVESPAGNDQVKCKDSMGNIVHQNLIGMLKATDENKKLIADVEAIQQKIRELKSQRDELVEKMEKFTL